MNPAHGSGITIQASVAGHGFLQVRASIVEAKHRCRLGVDAGGDGVEEFFSPEFGCIEACCARQHQSKGALIAKAAPRLAESINMVDTQSVPVNRTNEMMTRTMPLVFVHIKSALLSHDACSVLPAMLQKSNKPSYD
jgi:hypothetical protein